MTPTNGTVVGVHVIMNVYNVSENLLTSLDVGTERCDSIVQSLPLTVLQRTGHQFQPHGYTLLYLLSESHFSIHTYPEHRSCYLDIFCCNRTFDPAAAVATVSEAFCTQQVEYQVLTR
jgi:S-adenosylmethionine decarboxylase